MTEYWIREIPEFTTLTKNALLAIGIISTDDLALLNERDLIRIPNIGKKGKKAVIDYCLKNNIPFSQHGIFFKRKIRD